MAYKEDEILYMGKVSQVSPEVLATMNSSEGSRDTLPRTMVQELCAPRELEAPQQASQSAANPRNTIPDPSDTYLAPQFQVSFNQVARATMDEINRTPGRTLGMVVPSLRFDRSSSSSERVPRTVVSTRTAHGGTFQKSRVVDIRKNLMVRNQFAQVAAEHPRACLNGMRWNPATSNQVIPPGNRHLVIGDSLVRDLNEIFVHGQTTALSFGGAFVAQVIKMMKFQKQKASGALPTEFPAIEEKDDVHRVMMEVEPLLGPILMTHNEYPCHCLAQTLWYPKRGNMVLVWDAEELYSTRLSDQNQ